MHASNIRSIIPGYYVPVLLMPHQVCTYYFVGLQCTPAQVSPAIYSSAAQRSAVPCLALRFAVMCLAALCALLNNTAVPGMIQVPGTIMYVLCALCFLQLRLSSLGPHVSPSPQHHKYCRSERNINKRTAQHRAISSAQAPQLSIRTK